MFIQTEATPNPQTLKFLPGREVMAGEPVDLRSKDAAAASPLAAALFTISGVEGVFFGGDFIAVTKGDIEWAYIKPAVLSAIMEHFMSGQPLFGDGFDAGANEGEEEFFDAENSETVEVIKELLESRVRPAVAMDGGDIIFRGFREGTVYLHMQGACAGCPSSTATLKNGIENLLRHFVPGVEEVQQI